MGTELPLGTEYGMLYIQIACINDEKSYKPARGIAKGLRITRCLNDGVVLETETDSDKLTVQGTYMLGKKRNPVRSGTCLVHSAYHVNRSNVLCAVTPSSNVVLEPRFIAHHLHSPKVQQNKYQAAPPDGPDRLLCIAFDHSYTLAVVHRAAGAGINTKPTRRQLGPPALLLLFL
ncbi:uncharacterized protein UV8b_04711 [Ustilaginoidea virens]|uniref:Uncharacterized protein n=1 Tax=Ustilaginoidea virens TaxID=1159556 RepID=A0A8E5HRT6_USTVR|nr:uncharacterized protein UV8b_04711 [Ustilaginoidea virens]QUC20470.1 hypothetical protein UV8b_04711 [Ustilaginoidea virens]